MEGQFFLDKTGGLEEIKFSFILHCQKMAQGRQHIRIRNTDSEDPVSPVRNMLAEANLRKAELKQELRLNSVKLNSVKNQVYRNVQELAKGPPARRPNL